MQAFLSIVKNKEFWLTNLSYVNDEDEKNVLIYHNIKI